MKLFKLSNSFLKQFNKGFARMFVNCNCDKIFGSVIVSNTIEVVNLDATRQFLFVGLLPYITMFPHSFTINSNTDISTPFAKAPTLVSIMLLPSCMVHMTSVTMVGCWGNELVAIRAFVIYSLLPFLSPLTYFLTAGMVIVPCMLSIFICSHFYPFSPYPYYSIEGHHIQVINKKHHIKIAKELE